MRAIEDAGYTACNFASDKDLEVYFDVFKEGEDIGYMSRGWSDPGFRLSRQLYVSPAVADNLWSESFSEHCATSGVCFTTLLTTAGRLSCWRQ